MQTITVDNFSGDVVFGATGVAEVFQAVRTIITTRRGTVPLDREFGISHDFLDTPINTVQARIEQEIFLALKKYEPRAVIKKILWVADAISGKIWPTVELEVNLNVV